MTIQEQEKIDAVKVLVLESITLCAEDLQSKIKDCRNANETKTYCEAFKALAEAFAEVKNS